MTGASEASRTDLRRGATRSASRRRAGRVATSSPASRRSVPRPRSPSCSSRAARPARARPPRPRPRTRRPPGPRPPWRPPPDRRADPGPRAREGAVRLQLGRATSARNRWRKFEEKYGIKVTYDPFVDEPTQIGKLAERRQGRRVRRVSYPASTWIPIVHRRRDHPAARPDPDPEPREPRSRRGRTPGYDPDNALLRPQLLVDHGLRMEPEQDRGRHDDLGGALGPRPGQPHG